MLNAEKLEAHLAHFTGTEQYHRFSILFKNVVLTDGAMALAKEAECFWLFDAIASHQPTCMKDPKGMCQDMQFWHLDVNPNPAEGEPKAVLRCERDTNDELLRQEIEYTDFPLEHIKLYACRQPTENGDIMVVMLPSEY